MKKKVCHGWIQTRDSAVSIRYVAGVPLKLKEMKEKKTIKRIKGLKVPRSTDWANRATRISFITRIKILFWQPVLKILEIYACCFEFTCEYSTSVNHVNQELHINFVFFLKQINT